MWFALFIGGGKEVHTIYMKRRHNLRGQECHHQVSDNGLQVSLFFFLFILGMDKEKMKKSRKNKMREKGGRGEGGRLKRRRKKN
jgi:hypothetical protein